MGSYSRLFPAYVIVTMGDVGTVRGHSGLVGE